MLEHRGSSALSAQRASLALLVGGALCISFSPILVKVAVDLGTGPTAVAAWRTLLGGAILLLLAAARGNRLGLSRKSWWTVVAAGIVFSADLFLWHRSILLCGAGMATILGNTQVFVTAVLAGWIFKEWPGRLFVVAALAALVGILLLSGVGSVDVSLSSDRVWGIWLGLGTAVAYATYLVLLKLVRQDPIGAPALVVVGWISVVTGLVLAFAVWWTQEPWWPQTAMALLPLVGLGLLVQVLGWWIIGTAIPAVPAHRAGLVLLLQPALATWWGMIFFGEQLAFLQGVGAVVTMGAIYFGGLRPGPK